MKGMWVRQYLDSSCLSILATWTNLLLKMNASVNNYPIQRDLENRMRTSALKVILSRRINVANLPC
jgi:hypothetical protein